MFVLVDENARIGTRMEGCRDGRVLGAYERDQLKICTTVGVALIGPKVSDQLSSLSEELLVRMKILRVDSC